MLTDKNRYRNVYFDANNGAGGVRFGLQGLVDKSEFEVDNKKKVSLSKSFSGGLSKYKDNIIRDISRTMIGGITSTPFVSNNPKNAVSIVYTKYDTLFREDFKDDEEGLNRILDDLRFLLNDPQSLTYIAQQLCRADGPVGNNVLYDLAKVYEQKFTSDYQNEIESLISNSGNKSIATIIDENEYKILFKALDKFGLSSFIDYLLYYLLDGQNGYFWTNEGDGGVSNPTMVRILEYYEKEQKRNVTSTFKRSGGSGQIINSKEGGGEKDPDDSEDEVDQKIRSQDTITSKPSESSKMQDSGNPKLPPLPPKLEATKSNNSLNLSDINKSSLSKNGTNNILPLDRESPGQGKIDTKIPDQAKQKSNQERLQELENELDDPDIRAKVRGQNELEDFNSKYEQDGQGLQKKPLLNSTNTLSTKLPNKEKLPNFKPIRTRSDRFAGSQRNTSLEDILNTDFDKSAEKRVINSTTTPLQRIQGVIDKTQKVGRDREFQADLADLDDNKELANTLRKKAAKSLKLESAAIKAAKAEVGSPNKIVNGVSKAGEKAVEQGGKLAKAGAKSALSAGRNVAMAGARLAGMASTAIAPFIWPLVIIAILAGILIVSTVVAAYCIPYKELRNPLDFAITQNPTSLAGSVNWEVGKQLSKACGVCGESGGTASGSRTSGGEGYNCEGRLVSGAKGSRGRSPGWLPTDIPKAFVAYTTMISAMETSGADVGFSSPNCAGPISNLCVGKYQIPLRELSSNANDSVCVRTNKVFPDISVAKCQADYEKDGILQDKSQYARLVLRPSAPASILSSYFGTNVVQLVNESGLQFSDSVKPIEHLKIIEQELNSNANKWTQQIERQLEAIDHYDQAYGDRSKCGDQSIYQICRKFNRGQPVLRAYFSQNVFEKIQNGCNGTGQSASTSTVTGYTEDSTTQLASQTSPRESYLQAVEEAKFTDTYPPENTKNNSLLANISKSAFGGVEVEAAGTQTGIATERQRLAQLFRDGKIGSQDGTDVANITEGGFKDNLVLMMLKLYDGGISFVTGIKNGPTRGYGDHGAGRAMDFFAFIYHQNGTLKPNYSADYSMSNPDPKTLRVKDADRGNQDAIKITVEAVKIMDSANVLSQSIGPDNIKNMGVVQQGNTEIGGHDNHIHYAVTTGQFDSSGVTAGSTSTNCNDPCGNQGGRATTGPVSTSTGPGTVSKGGPFTPEVRAFLDVLAKDEVPNYLERKSYFYGNLSLTATFTEAQAQAGHPGTVGGGNNVGRYQFNPGDYTDAKAADPEIKNYLPEGQDRVALYKLKYRNAYDPLMSGNLEIAFTRASAEWESVVGFGDLIYTGGSPRKGEKSPNGRTLQDEINLYNQRLQYYKSNTTSFIENLESDTSTLAISNTTPQTQQTQNYLQSLLGGIQVEAAAENKYAEILGNDYIKDKRYDTNNTVMIDRTKNPNTDITFPTTPQYFIMHITTNAKVYDNGNDTNALAEQFSGSIPPGTAGGFTPFGVTYGGKVGVFYDPTKYWAEGTDGKLAKIFEITADGKSGKLLHSGGGKSGVDAVSVQVEMIANNGEDATLAQATSTAKLIAASGILPDKLLAHYAVQPSDRSMDNPFIAKDGSVDSRLVKLVNTVRQYNSAWKSNAYANMSDEKLAAMITKINLIMAKANGDDKITQAILDKLGSDDLVINPTTPTTTGASTNCNSPTTPYNGPISASGQKLLNYAKQDSQGKAPDGRCLENVNNYIDAVGFGSIPRPTIRLAEAYMYGEWLITNGSKYGITNLLDKNPNMSPYDAPAGSIVVVTDGSPGTSHKTAGDIAVADGTGKFYNGGEMAYQGKSSWKGNIGTDNRDGSTGKVIGIFVADK